jgi:uncharacterized protein YbbC (DUF1343 family)
MKTAIAFLVVAAAAAQQPVATGLDVLVGERFARLDGAKVGLITNHTGLTADGGGIVEAFLAQDACELVCLFSPEHGFEGRLDQEEVADARHSSGVPIRSLYGKSRKPTAEMLAGIDALVFDIQDIGARFYTYVGTMRLAMEAGAEAKLRFLVLDRPNPIGGERVEGPVLDSGLETFVGWHTVPVRHGMTVGELASMMNEERAIGCRLDVVACRGWRRADLFDATGLLWIDPSPNMRTLNQALLYPGVGLLETTNVSVGRGTDAPFERIGAPWIDAQALAARLRARAIPGVAFVPFRFTPSASVHARTQCQGVQILIADRALLDSVRVGIELACALRDLFGDKWQAARFGRLLGDRAVLEAVQAGRDPAAIEALWREELDAFQTRRARFTIYE